MNRLGPARLAGVRTQRAFGFSETLVRLGLLIAARPLQAVDSNNVALSSRG
jgi:hypothetical protein